MPEQYGGNNMKNNLKKSGKHSSSVLIEMA